MNSSPNRGQIRKDRLLKALDDGDSTIEHVTTMLSFYDQFDEIQKNQEQSIEWQEHNLEHDLRSTKWICDKVKASDVYAQNLYAAMCNREFQKNAVWPILQSKFWSCTWRYAGGIVADMREQGDYLDWYCTGIRGDTLDDESYQAMTEQDQELYVASKSFVSEGHVTDEIQQDLLKLGWLVLEEESAAD
jgi:hypothetical protein